MGINDKLYRSCLIQAASFVCNPSATYPLKAYFCCMPKLIVIAGPTGVGKTATAIELAKELNTEIISADSRQFFKEMRIGTAVPSPEELNQVKHHLIQHLSIRDNYNVSKYEFEALDLLEKLFQTHEYVVLVGGSGLYINALCKGIDDLPSVPKEIRDKFEQLFETKGLEHIQDLLKELDPEHYKRVDLNNHKRVLKALEISHISGKPYSSLLSHKAKVRPFQIIKVILNLDREVLYDRINRRVDIMVEEGLIDEVRSLHEHKNLTPLKTVGYKELFEHFEGKLSLDEAITKIKNHSRKYARKQITWFRKEHDAQWFEPNQITEIMKYIKHYE